MRLLENQLRELVSAASILLLSLTGSAALPAQVTTINVNNSVIQSQVKPFGINLGATNYYDSGQMMKNLILNNPGFEGEIAQSMVQCVSGTATSCTHPNAYSGWPDHFWDGATYQFVYGNAIGRSGTVANYVGANGTAGGVFNFANSGTASGPTDYMIVRKPMPGNAADGWNPYSTGAGTVSTNLTDLPPSTQGLQTAYFTAPNPGDSATLTAYFDSTAGRTFVQLNGEYQLTFKAKGLSAGSSVLVQMQRDSDPTIHYIDSTINLTNSWQTYTLTFNASENGSAIGTAQLSFGTVGTDSFYLDDVSLVQLNTDPTNTTVFRDPVVDTLQQLNPGVLRFWFNQLGESLDNLLAPPLGRQRSTYSAYSIDTTFVEYGLTDFLQLCQKVGADPWIVLPMTLSNTEASNLIDYLASGTNTVYGAKRAAAGQIAPWTTVFKTIHLEFGNEAWDSLFNGGDMEIPQAYGTRASAVFAAMRANNSYNASSFDLVINGIAAYPPLNTTVQSYCNNNDSFTGAPYMMYTVNDPADSGYTGAAAIEDIFGSTFAEAEAMVTNSGTAENVANGMVLQNQLAVQASGYNKPYSTAEFNISPYQGDATQAELDSYASSVGAGVAVADGMLQQLRVGVLTQNLFDLVQYQRPLSALNGQARTVNLFGAVLDMGVTNRKRPQFLAEQLANSAIGAAGAAMLQTVQTGANPTWNQALVQDVQLNNVHYLQSFAFNSGSQYSLVLFNTSRTSALPVTFGGQIVPAGTVQMQQLTSANITDTNENAQVVAPVSATLSSFNPAASFSLPPFSMTVLSWTGGQTQTAPRISSVAVSAVTATSATIAWTTDVPASSQVNFGTGTGYGSSSTLDPTLVTSHTVTLTGLTPGTTYDFDVVSANATSQSTTSPNSTFSTPAAVAPYVGYVSAWDVNNTGATVSWSTDVPASTQLAYGTSPSLGQMSPLQTALTANHGVVLTGLNSGTTYYFVAQSTGANGVTGSSTLFSFTTTGTAATAPPVVSYVSFWGITTSGITISWSTNVPANTAVAYGTSSSLGQLSPLQTALTLSHGVTLTGLSPGTTYYFAAQSANAGGSTGSSTIYSFTTLAGPPAISNVTASPGANNAATLAWTTSAPTYSFVQAGKSAGNYQFYSATTALTTTPVCVLKFVPSGTVHYQLVSTDASGNQTTSPDMTFTEP